MRNLSVTSLTTLQRSLWLFPASFIIHDAEELATMPAWVDENRSTLAAIAGFGPLTAHFLGRLVA